MEKIKDYLLMEEDIIRNQDRLKPLEERYEEGRFASFTFIWEKYIE